MSVDNIDSLISQSVMGRRDWRILARIILECEEQKLWKGQANSFSAWLKWFAGQLGVHIANLWRFRRAANAAFVFWGGGGQRRINSLMDIPDGVSPESIEILEKISRAAPSYVVGKLASRLFEKQVTMKELRLLWNKFRPALEGDARGRNKLAPKLPRGDERRKNVLFHNLVVEPLEGMNLMDIGYEPGSHIQVLSKVFEPECGSEIDVVFIVQSNNGLIDIHGVQIVTGRSDVRPAQLNNITALCDFTWAALPFAPNPDEYNNFSENVGLMYVGDMRTDVLRMPTKSGKGISDQMARAIIKRLMH